ACEPWFSAELGFILADLRVIVCLGHYAWQAVWRDLGKAGFAVPKPRPAFGHGVEVHVDPPPRSGPPPKPGPPPRSGQSAKPGPPPRSDPSARSSQPPRSTASSAAEPAS